MSSLEINKIAASILLAGVIAMSAGFIATLLTTSHELEEPVYLVAGETGGEASEAAAEQMGPAPVLPLLASADPAAGEKDAKKCAACHTFDEGGANKIGPNLYGVVGRQIAAVSDFGYSGALQEHAGDAWSYQNLNAFLAKPKDFAPGTKMTFAGFKKVEDRADVIAYLRTLSGSPMPLPSAEEAAAAAEAAESAGGMAESAAETASGVAQGAAETVSGMAESAAETVSGMAESAAETAGEVAQSAADTTSQMAESAAETAGSMAESAAETAESAGGGGLGTQIAAADPQRAKKVSRKCAACHSFEQGGKNKIGPNLYGVIGRPVASVEGFNYSAALSGMSGEAWSYESLAAYLTKPKDYAPGTKMTFAGLRKEEDRAAILAFLRTYHDDPPPLPE